MGFLSTNCIKKNGFGINKNDYRDTLRAVILVDVYLPNAVFFFENVGLPVQVVINFLFYARFYIFDGQIPVFSALKGDICFRFFDAFDIHDAKI